MRQWKCHWFWCSSNLKLSLKVLKCGSDKFCTSFHFFLLKYIFPVEHWAEFCYRQKSPAHQILFPCGSSQRLWWHCSPSPRLRSTSTFGGWGSFLASLGSGWHPMSHIARRGQDTELEGREKKWRWRCVRWAHTVFFKDVRLRSWKS